MTTRPLTLWDIAQRLRHGVATASNDDASTPMSPRRARHAERIEDMIVAADALEDLHKAGVQAPRRREDR